MHNSTTANELKNIAQLLPSKKSVKVSFVTSGIEKMRKKVGDFLFLPKGVCRTAPATPDLLITDPVSWGYSTHSFIINKSNIF